VGLFLTKELNMDIEHREHIRIRLIGIMDAIVHKETTITQLGISTLLGLDKDSKELALLIAELSPEQKRVIFK